MSCDVLLTNKLTNNKIMADELYEVTGIPCNFQIRYINIQ